jgi:putative transposase
LVKVAPLLEIAGEWKLFLAGAEAEEQMADIRKHERTGRPLGSVGFIEKLELILERLLMRGKPGPKGKHN